MKGYVKTFLNYYGLTPADTVLCWVCGRVASDIHHIECRGMGGSKSKDNIENLIPLCRKCHDTYGDKKQYKELLKKLVQEHGH